MQFHMKMTLPGFHIIWNGNRVKHEKFCIMNPVRFETCIQNLQILRFKSRIHVCLKFELRICGLPRPYRAPMMGEKWNLDKNEVGSPTRNYVCICNFYVKPIFSGHPEWLLRDPLLHPKTNINFPPL